MERFQREIIVRREEGSREKESTRLYNLEYESVSMQNETLCEYRLTLSRKKLIDNKINVREIKDPTETYHNIASSGNGDYPTF